MKPSYVYYHYPLSKHLSEKKVPTAMQQNLSLDKDTAQEIAKSLISTIFQAHANSYQI